MAQGISGCLFLFGLKNKNKKNNRAFLSAGFILLKTHAHTCTIKKENSAKNRHVFRLTAVMHR